MLSRSAISTFVGTFWLLDAAYWQVKGEYAHACVGLSWAIILLLVTFYNERKEK
jgi:hypothetical protein